MTSRYLIAAVLLAANCGGVWAQDKLPATVADAFALAGILQENVSLVVKEPGAHAALISLNADKSMNPASVMKLFTTYAGLELLGPAYTWKTEAYAACEVHGNTLNGHLVLKGGGDPKLTVDRFANLLMQLRGRWLCTICCDLILDRTFFDAAVNDPAAFDGEPL